MSLLGKTMTVRGEVRIDTDITIECRVEGPIFCEGGAVVVAASGDVTGNVIARDITVFGRVAGQLVATDVVDIRAGAIVTGDVISASFILNPGAEFHGRVEPQHLDAALRVARFKQKQRDDVQSA